MNLEVRLRPFSVGVESADRGFGKSDQIPFRHQTDRPGHDEFASSTDVSANQRDMTMSKYLSKIAWLSIFVAGIGGGLYLKFWWIGKTFYSFHF